MSITDKEHKAFVRGSKDPVFLENLKRLTPVFKNIVKGEIPVWRRRGDEKGAQFLEWINRMSNLGHYLIAFRDKGMFCLYPRNLKSTIAVGFMWASDKTALHLKGYDENIEVSGLHSLQKGEAYKLMKQVIEIAKQLQVPVLLFTETDKLKAYYERYGFESCGRIGTDNEYLMILFPKEEDKHGR